MLTRSYKLTMWLNFLITKRQRRRTLSEEKLTLHALLRKEKKTPCELSRDRIFSLCGVCNSLTTLARLLNHRMVLHLVMKTSSVERERQLL